MRPVRLEMEAFASYGGHEVVDFTKPRQNLFLITGDTGAGKTTIFDGIVFALYGENSSTQNRKDGIELVSQFASVDVEPYVELTFTQEGIDGEEEYKIRRVPLHYKRVTRGANKGKLKTVSSSVTLTMPDGMVYPSKETDAKIIEIVGLDRGQFAQVAMIAQGEFMTVLRAPSKDKKLIFRKLFGTDLYDRVAVELRQRANEKMEQVNVIRQTCATIAAGLEIPPNYEKREELLALREKIKEGSLSYMEEFLSLLTELNEYLREEETKSDEEKNQVAKELEEISTLLTRGMELKNAYEIRKSAGERWKELMAQKEERQKEKILLEQLQGADQIQAAYKLYLDAQREADRVSRQLEEAKASYPALEAKAKESEQQHKKSRDRLTEQSERSGKVREMARKSLELFSQMEQAKENLVKVQMQAKEGREAYEKLQQSLTEMEEKEAVWAVELKALPQVQKESLLKKNGLAVAQELLGTIEEEERAEAYTKKLTENLALGQKRYEEAKEDYRKEKEGYERQYGIFLDAQAGVLARSLTEGSPCPVCGSTEHPKPFVWMGEAEVLTKEELDQYKEQVEEKNRKMMELATKCNETTATIREREETGDKRREQIGEKLNTLLGEVQSGLSCQEMREALLTHMAVLEKEQEAVSQKLKELQDLEKEHDRLRSVHAKRKEETALAAEKEKKLTADLARATSLVESLKDTGEFKTREEAMQADEKAEKDLLLCRKEEEQAAAVDEADRKALLEVSSRMQSLTEELPKRQEEKSRRAAEYEEWMQKKQLQEEAWQKLLAEYAPEQIKKLRQGSEEYAKEVASVAASMEAADQTIAGREQMDLAALSEKKEKVSERLALCQQNWAAARQSASVARQIYDRLAPGQEERKAAIGKQEVLEHLADKLSGKLTGSRMDLETFVQRYYLQKILVHANRRFTAMTASQYRLELMELEDAATGKNKGLDLMVHSFVNGGKRPVNTLSGGESFMAALSMALGMADQIQESAAGIRLDVMFIDEGFGSLDDRSRNEAVRILSDMAGDQRLIGIISHVNELKTKIDDQLIITKDEKGSHSRWVIS